MAFYISHNRLMATLFHHLRGWANGSYILYIVIQTLAYASFYGMGLNLHHAMSSQIGSIIANLIWWAHSPPFSHLTDWAGSPFVFLLKGSRVKTQGSHCFSRLFMEGFPIKLVHLVLFRYKKDWAFHISYITFFYSVFFSNMPMLLGIMLPFQSNGGL